MGHSIRVTPGFIRYCERYQPGSMYDMRRKVQAQAPQPKPVEQAPSDPNAPYWVEYARMLTLTLIKRMGHYEFNRFWGLIPDDVTAKQDAELCEHFTSLLDQHGSEDKAIAAFRAYVKGGGE